MLGINMYKVKIKASCETSNRQMEVELKEVCTRNIKKYIANLLGDITSCLVGLDKLSIEIERKNK